jgi:hypothetical protein
MISYAGQAFTLPDLETQSWVRDNISPEWIGEWAARTWPTRGFEHLPFHGHLPRGPIQVGRLTWPSGACRWAYGHFLCDEVALAAIRLLTHPSGGSWTPQKLVIDDGRRKIEPEMFCLPARPLARVAPGVPGLYLLTLVDDRWFWWWESSLLDVGEGASWSDYYDAIGAELDVDIVHPTISADYGLPPADLIEPYRYLPPLLDAVAYAVGQRIVRRFDGSVLALDPLTSLATMKTNLEKEGQAFLYGNKRIAGHEMDLTLQGGGGAYNIAPAQG